MDISIYRENIKLQLTGGLLDLELNDEALDKIINVALIEIQRYICSTEIATIPYSRCIDLNKVTNQFGEKFKANSIVRVFRATGYTAATEEQGTVMDPMQVAQWQMLSFGGDLYNLQDYAYNFMSWNTMGQIRNTLSTDLIFRFDKKANKLYINTSTNLPTKITIEYVPRYDNVDEIVSDYWIDMLGKLALSYAKIAVGRIRSRYTQSNALWTQDGETLLNEGNTELQELRQYLQKNTQLIYGID